MITTEYAKKVFVNNFSNEELESLFSVLSDAIKEKEKENKKEIIAGGAFGADELIDVKDLKVNDAFYLYIKNDNDNTWYKATKKYIKVVSSRDMTEYAYNPLNGTVLDIKTLIADLTKHGGTIKAHIHNN